MKRKNFFLFFILPLTGVLLIFFVFSSINRNYIKKNVEESVKEQLYGTAEILKVNISYFLKENFTSDDIFARYADEQNLYYMALIDSQKQILGWISRFEGYLPLSSSDIGERESWILDSPAGKIFNIILPFRAADLNDYYLYLGYSLQGLENMMAHSRLSFFVIFGVIIFIGAVFFLGLYKLQNSYLEKEREVETEKREKERFREISAFTSGVAHEIKNPLNSISLLCELMRKRAPEGLQKDVSLCKREVHKISEIIEKFSAAQKPLKLKKENFSLEDLVRDVRSALRAEIEEKQVHVIYSEDHPHPLYADKQLIGQSFINLLNNALGAEAQGEIRIHAGTYKNGVQITIQDFGKGIAEEDKPFIFYPFYSQKEKGMGVGLYLTKKIIDAHDGKIEFQSEQGKGTTFSVFLPRGRHD